jgi:hypothetical protein
MDPLPPDWIQQYGRATLALLSGGAFAAWCLWGINWRRGWQVLAAGGWVPLVLIAVVAAYVCSRVWPTPVVVLGLLIVPNIVWQFAAVAALVGLALFCGWLQGRLGWTPPEVDFSPPAHGDHGHGHDHHPAHAAH